MDQSLHNKMTEVRDLHAERGRLFDELEESLSLETIWPEVFDHGSAKCRVDGFLNSPSKAKLIITNGIGEKRVILLRDAPRAVRARHVKAFAPDGPYVFTNFFKRLDKEEDRANKAK